MPPRRRYEWERDLGPRSRIHVRWETERDVLRYAVVLLVFVDAHWQPTVLFDCSHDDRNDRHRFTRDGAKLPAETFHHGTPAEGMRAAARLILAESERMIERWLP